MAKKNFVGAKGARLLRRVARHILEEPDRYNQNKIILRKGDPTVREDDKFPRCGTIACIGGWAAILSGLERFDYWNTDQGLCDRMEIDREAAKRLFGSTNDAAWPVKFLRAYLEAKTARDRAQVAAERIEHFIKTGE